MTRPKGATDEEWKAYRQAEHRRYYVSHREAVKSKAMDYYYTHQEQVAAYQKCYRAAHPEVNRAALRKWYAANTTKARAWTQAWESTHPESRATRARRRRATLANASANDLSHAQWVEIQVAQDHRCYYCGKRRKGKLTQDHITPLSRGGSHTLHNVIAVCSSCNSRKRTKKPPIPVQPLLLTLAPAKPSRRRNGQEREGEFNPAA